MAADTKYLVPLLDQTGHQSAADETAAAGDKDPHLMRRRSSLC
jgi:hypothetical protein